MNSYCQIASRALLPGLLLAGACGGGTTGPSGGANFSANITGLPHWTAASAFAQAVISTNATFSLVGGDLNANNPVGMSLTLYFITKPGTYPLGVGGSVPGGSATLTQGSNAWWTALSGSAGSVIISSVSTTHIAGHFTYSAIPFFSGTTGNKEVTGGEFDLPVTGTGTLTVPDNLGSTFGGSLGGNPWNAATVVTVTHPSSGTLTIGASNTDYNMNLIISGFTGQNVYQLGTGVTRSATVIRTGALQTWGGSNALSSGTVTVTGYTSTRVSGSYDFTLQPGVASPGPGTLRLTGNFSVGLQ